MDWMNSIDFRLLERFLDLAATRQTLLSSNIANVDTPNYHTRDIDFRGELNKVLENGDSADLPAVVREVPGLVARPDGNNVSVDREGLLLGEVQLQFSIATEILRAKFSQWATAIKEGS